MQVVKIWNGKTFPSINEAEIALSSLLKDGIDSLCFIIRSKNRSELDEIPLLDMIENISKTYNDIKKLEECKKWVSD